MAVDWKIENAIGSLQRPLSDRDLETKFVGLVDPVLPHHAPRKLMDLCWNIEALPDAAELAKSPGFPAADYT